jgi:exopolyphosphatase/guanosine-5'-triphosphate,3'-diphosphate pyrophosphatase
MKKSLENNDEKSQIESSTQVAKNFCYDTEHNQQVVNLSLKLFDELKPLHELGDKEKFWLHNSAILHDIGLIEGQKGHHKATLRHILEDKTLKFDDNERLIIASIARYHRSALPKKKHKHYVSLNKKDRNIVSILAGILRIADGLDRSHTSNIKDTKCEYDDEKIIIKCFAESQSEMDREAALDKGKLAEKVFKRKLDIQWEISNES